jgi:hypothetical protein
VCRAGAHFNSSGEGAEEDRNDESRYPRRGFGTYIDNNGVAVLIERGGGIPDDPPPLLNRWVCGSVNACAKLKPPGTSPQLTLGGFPSTRWRNDTICACLEGEIIAKNMSVPRTQV